MSVRISALCALLLVLLLAVGCDPVRSSGTPSDDDDATGSDDDDDDDDDDDTLDDDDDTWANDDDSWVNDDDSWWDDDDSYYEQDWDGDGWTYLEDCDDYNAEIYPGAPEVCDGRDSDCDGVLPEDELDQDWDGVQPCAGDCDDLNNQVNPFALEVCDGFDNNCDGIMVDGEDDLDGDGWHLCDADCDDTDPSVYPSAPDACEDGIDQNCDGVDPTCGLCDEFSEVEYNGDCYYLDGSGGVCDSGYQLARQNVLTAIATSFIGKTYKNQQSDNCCIAHGAQAAENQDWGMETSSCNTAGTFTTGPVLGGSSCNDALNMYPLQLTLCRSL
jgi:hypothetical protein